jgi:nitroreductase
MDFDLPTVDSLLTTTRAVRKRLDLERPVPREVVLECLRLALQAPTGGNTQRWRWLVVDDPEVRAGLAELYRRAADPYLGAQKRAIEEAGRGGMDSILGSALYLSDHLHEVPVHVIPIALDRPPTAPADAAGWFGSIIPAAWSFQLALRSRGLGSAWTTLHLHYEKESAELLGLPDTVTQIALLPVAYTKGTDFKPGQRRPVEEVTYFNRWKGSA